MVGIEFLYKSSENESVNKILKRFVITGRGHIAAHFQTSPEELRFFVQGHLTEQVSSFSRSSNPVFAASAMIAKQELRCTGHRYANSSLYKRSRGHKERCVITMTFQGPPLVLPTESIQALACFEMVAPLRRSA